MWGGSGDTLLTYKENLEFNQVGVSQNYVSLLLKQPLEPGCNISVKSFLTDDRDCSGRSTEQVILGK